MRIKELKKIVVPRLVRGIQKMTVSLDTAHNARYDVRFAWFNNGVGIMSAITLLLDKLKTLPKNNPKFDQWTTEIISNHLQAQAQRLLIVPLDDGLYSYTQESKIAFFETLQSDWEELKNIEETNGLVEFPEIKNIFENVRSEFLTKVGISPAELLEFEEPVLMSELPDKADTPNNDSDDDELSSESVKESPEDRIERIITRLYSRSDSSVGSALQSQQNAAASASSSIVATQLFKEVTLQQDVAFKIMDNLGVMDILKLAVNKNWIHHVYHPAYWERRLKRDFNYIVNPRIPTIPLHEIYHRLALLEQRQPRLLKHILLEYLYKGIPYPPLDQSILIDEVSTEVKIEYLKNAVKLGNLDLVRWIFETAPKHLNLMPHGIQVRIHDAARSGSLALVRWFVKESGLPDCKTNKYILDEAAKSGSVTLITWLVNELGLIPDARTLNNAAESGNLTLVCWLIESFGLIPDQLTLQNAVISGNVALVKYLVEGGPGRNAIAPEQYLMGHALEHGRLSVVKYLMEEAPVKLNLPSDALSVALYSGNIGVIRWVIDTTPQKEGFLSGKDIENIILQKDLSLVRWFVEKAPQAYRLKPNVEMLINAAHDNYWHVDIVKYFLEGAPVELRLKPNQEMLRSLAMQASYYRNMDIIRYLVEEILPKDARLIPNQQMLNYAAANRNYPLLHYLVREMQPKSSRLNPNNEVLNAIHFDDRDDPDLRTWLYLYMATTSETEKPWQTVPGIWGFSDLITRAIHFLQSKNPNKLTIDTMAVTILLIIRHSKSKKEKDIEASIKSILATWKDCYREQLMVLDIVAQELQQKPDSETALAKGSFFSRLFSDEYSPHKQGLDYLKKIYFQILTSSLEVIANQINNEKRDGTFMKNKKRYLHQLNTYKEMILDEPYMQAASSAAMSSSKAGSFLLNYKKTAKSIKDVEAMFTKVIRMATSTHSAAPAGRPKI